MNLSQAAGSARSYHFANSGVNRNEAGSITSGSHDGCLGESISSGYWSKSENTQENELEKLENLKKSVESSKIGRWHIPKQDFIVNRVEVKEAIKKNQSKATNDKET